MKRTCPALALLALIAATPALAQDSDTEPTWHLGGFGTLGAGYHSRDGIQFRRDLEQAKGYEGGKLGFRTDTRLGVQANATFNPRWSAMMQGVSWLNSEGNWQPQVTWAFVRYSPTDWLDLRFGRLGVDIYLDGDSRHVGYAYTPARPPSEVFGMVTQDRFDGMDVTLRHALGSGVASLKLYGGRSRGDYYLFGQPYTSPYARTLGATLEWSGESLTLRAAWGDIHTQDDTSLQPLARALSSVALPAPFQAQQALAQLRASEIDGFYHLTFSTVSAQYEDGPFSLQTLLGWERHTNFPGYEGWGTSVIAGYRIGAWKPYVTYARSCFGPKERSLVLPPLVPQLTQLQSFYDLVVNRLNSDQHSFGAGVRYDFASNYALKFQVDHVSARESTLLMDNSGMPARNTSLTLYSVVVDFVF
jgi:hypothetical protein